MLRPYQDAIIHLDADAFFASVEQSMNPHLKGKPVVTGKERGIIACASYEAKKLGVSRGLSLRDAKKMCPGLVVLPSDYETYSIYSKRMFDIMRHYTPMVEESSVDEAFADLAGMRRVFRTGYKEIALRMKEEIKDCLDITVSIGLSTSKSIAKLASSYRKPDGLTAIPGTVIHRFLPMIPVGDVWGIGPHGSRLMKKYGVNTAYDFVCSDEEWVAKLLDKPGREIWNELRGNSKWPVITEELPPRASISKTKTFSAPSGNIDYVYARLVRNVESAFIKLRRHKLRARFVGMLLRRSTYEEKGYEAKLNRPTSSTQEVMPVIRTLFDMTYQHGVEYRSAMVYLTRLEEQGGAQLDLFEDRVKIENMERASAAIDEINRKYGKHKVSLGSSLFLANGPLTEKDVPAERKQKLLDGETERQRLGIPMMMIDV